MTKVAVVTGGTRGIGEAISLALKAEGYKVAANYANNHTAAKDFSERNSIPVYSFSVRDTDSCVKGVRQIESDLGGHVEILVNNAGITRDTTIQKMTYEQWSEVIQTNLDSCFNMTKAILDGMREHNFGRIINISSINGLAGQYGQTNYAASKAGLIGFTKSLALETAKKGITVNAIAPGYVDTDMVRAVVPEVLEKIVARIPVGRLGHVEDIARAVVFLANPHNGFITGETISINGGMYMS